MQTIYLDISKKSIIPPINAKQNDAGRKFKVFLFDGGIPYNADEEVNFSLWYAGESGDGNYDTVAEESAFYVEENSVIVELSPQMLKNPGSGQMCLTMSDSYNRTIGLWNIAYEVEAMPGYPSDQKKPYYPSIVRTVNGVAPDENGNVVVEVPEGGGGGGGIAAETDPTVPAWAKNATKPSYSKSEVGLGNVDNVKQYSASNPPPYPVTSVNGKTGAVSLDAAAVGARPSTWMPSASDVGALPASTTIPTKVSQLTNDKGYLTQHQDISGKLDASALPTAINTALAQAKASGEFDGKDGLPGTPGTDGNDGYTPVRGKDYYTEADKAEFSQYIASELAKRGQLKPEFAQSEEWLKANGEQDKLYVLPNDMIWAYMLTEKEVATGGYDNRLLKATETYNGTTVYGNGKGYVTGVRLSSSGSASSSDGMLATGFISAPNGGSLDGARIRTVGVDVSSAPMQCYVISYNASGVKINHYTWSGGDVDTANGYIADFTLDSATYGTGIKYIRISASAKGSTLPSIVTVNEEIKESGTEIIITEGWASTGHAFVPADYEERIVELEAEVEDLNAEVETLNEQIGKASVSRLSVSEVFAPSPQLPADGSETADFNGILEHITAEQIYAYIDALLNKYPRFITKEVMGKDASGTHDWCRYVCSRRAYNAWQKPNYPPMYAWVNGSTVIYSVSVSPRVGDTLYTTKYVGTAKGAVTAVNNANQSRTVGGVVYTRDKTKDVAPTLVYTAVTYSPYFSTNYASYKSTGVYDGSKAKISTIASITNGVLKDASGATYTRYPLGDRNSQFKEIPAIVIAGNEHGTGGDPATPAMVAARMAKDLCECKNADNPLLNLLKNEYMVVFCPVVNPWGLHKDNHSYYNSNGINLDRNFDTPGWMPQSEEPSNWPTGAYGGSEVETQYFMNTLVASKAKIAMCNHSYGHGIDSKTGEAVSGGICSYMMGRNKSKYNASLLRIAEVMAANYNLVFTDNGEAPPEIWAKTRSYFEWIGVDGVALEMNSREGFITDPNNEAQGKQFTARVMEAAYTQLLQVLYMLMDKQGV